jgi:[ribosomal protein S5]-alanine N-acetyltransferase
VHDSVGPLHDSRQSLNDRVSSQHDRVSSLLDSPLTTPYTSRRLVPGMDHRLPALLGRRLLLREPTPADAERLYAYTSDREVTRFLAFDPPGSIDDTRQFIARAEVLRQQDREYVFTIADRGTDEPLGVTGLRHIDPELGTAEVGSWVRRESWGQGVNTEAKGLLLEYAFGPLRLHRIEARIAVDNLRSRRAFEKLGAQWEGTLRESLRKDGVWLDQALYAILAPAWQARNPTGDRREEAVNG